LTSTLCRILIFRVGEFPFAVKEELIIRTVKSWHQPVSAAFERAERIFLDRLTSLVDTHFGKHAFGGLRTIVMQVLIRLALNLSNLLYRKIVLEKLEECKTSTQQELEFLLDMESLPFTLNSHYYMDYKEKFLKYYASNADEQSLLALSLRNNSAQPTGSEDSPNSVEQALKHLRDAGFAGVRREDLIRLLPSDFARQSALEIMASARAYYQGGQFFYLSLHPLTRPSSCIQTLCGYRSARNRPTLHSSL
jgi:hypothetical protein